MRASMCTIRFPCLPCVEIKLIYVFKAAEEYRENDDVADKSEEKEQTAADITAQTYWHLLIRMK